MEYKASLDTLSKVITTGVIILFLIIGQRSIRALIAAQGDITNILMQAGILLFLIVALVVCYSFGTQKYLVSNNELVIKRPIKERRIHISDIEEIRLVAPGDMLGTIRTFGVGGLFGYYGLYYNKGFGSVTLYATQRKNRIFIRTKSGDKIIISPDDMNLLDKLKSEMHWKR